jgi:hypothetical protein
MAGARPAFALRWKEKTVSYKRLAPADEQKQQPKIVPTSCSKRTEMKEKKTDKPTSSGQDAFLASRPIQHHRFSPSAKETEADPKKHRRGRCDRGRWCTTRTQCCARPSCRRLVARRGISWPSASSGWSWTGTRTPSA